MSEPKETHERAFEGIWIPKEIWLDKDLAWSEKILLAEINSLAKLPKGCFATNAYFAEFFELSKDRISKLISNLREMGYIELKFTYVKDTKQVDKRFITTRGYRRKQLEGIGMDDYGGIGENNEDNSTDIINSENNTENNIGVAVHSDDSFLDEQTPHPKRVKIKEPSTEPKKEQGIINEGNTSLSNQELIVLFDQFRKAYPGSKGGLKVEWENFTKKNKKEYHLIVPILKEAVDKEIKHKQQLKDSKQFCPSWKNLSTWINNKCWEQEFGKIEDNTSQVNGSRNNYPNTSTSEGASVNNASERKFDNITSMINDSII